MTLWCRHCSVILFYGGDEQTMKSVYEVCPVYRTERMTLRQTMPEDAEELLKCYSDEQSLPFFNADNCPDNFYYTSTEQMKSEIKFWRDAYANKGWVRWTVILNDTCDKVGTVEMFHRPVPSRIGSHGVLRIDLRSDCENRKIIRNVLAIAQAHFYRDFDVNSIVTKAFPNADERNDVLKQSGYKPLPFEIENYLGRKE